MGEPISIIFRMIKEVGYTSRAEFIKEAVKKKIIKYYIML